MDSPASQAMKGWGAVWCMLLFVGAGCIAEQGAEDSNPEPAAEPPGQATGPSGGPDGPADDSPEDAERERPVDSTDSSDGGPLPLAVHECGFTDLVLPVPFEAAAARTAPLVPISYIDGESGRDDSASLVLTMVDCTRSGVTGAWWSIYVQPPGAGSALGAVVLETSSDSIPFRAAWEAAGLGPVTSGGHLFDGADIVAAPYTVTASGAGWSAEAAGLKMFGQSGLTASRSVQLWGADLETDGTPVQIKADSRSILVGSMMATGIELAAAGAGPTYGYHDHGASFRLG